MAPKVFISHASEDKQRFVADFAVKLRQQGIDAWYDDWEIQPGDSLVQKVFEGIKDADAIIVVLSKHSIHKRWVQAELDASIVRQIEERTRLIPVIIDDLDPQSIPMSLRSTKWVRVDPSNYDASIGQIVDVLFGVVRKPAVGRPPTYVTLLEPFDANLTPADTTVFKIVCDFAMEHGRASHIRLEPLLDRASQYGLTQVQCIESLEFLREQGYLRLTGSIGSPIDFVSTTTWGFEQYCRRYIESYDEFVKKIAAEIVNNSASSNTELARSLSVPIRLVDHVLERFAEKGLIKVSKRFDGSFIYGVSRSLERFVSNA